MAAAAALPFLAKLGGGSALAGGGLALAIGGTLFQGISSFAASRTNAKVLQQRQALALQRGELAKRRVEREGDDTASAALADFSASGVDLSSGSVLAVLGRIAEDSALDAELALFEGQLEASDLGFQADNQKAAGNRALVGSLVSAGGTFATQRARMNAINSTGKSLLTTPSIE